MKHASFSLVLLACAATMGTALAAPELRRTVSDDITLPSAPEGGTFATVSGDIRVTSSAGALTANTVSGDVQSETIDGNFTLRDVSGDMTVQSVGGNADLRAVSGDLTLGTVRGSVMARTSSGDLTIAHLIGNLDAASASGDVTARLDWSGTSPHTVLTESASGDAVLHVPHDFSGTVDLETFQTRSQANEARIVQNLGLPVTPGPWLPEHGGGEVRRIVVHGVIGDGTQNHVTVHGHSSKITILRD